MRYEHETFSFDQSVFVSRYLYMLPDIFRTINSICTWFW